MTFRAKVLAAGSMAVLLLGTSCLLWAQVASQPTQPPDTSRLYGELVIIDDPLPELEVPHTTLTPKIDGDANDPAWATAARIGEMTVSIGPNGKGLKPLPTQVLVLWDANYLYTRFICTDEEIYSPYTGRDEPHYKGDVVEIFLDPKGDQKQFFELQVSPKNEVLDQVVTVTAEPNFTLQLMYDPITDSRDVWFDLSYTMTGWRTATGPLLQDGKQIGWIVDSAIPAAPALRRLGMNKFAPMTMRINFLRYDWAPGENGQRNLTAMNWSPVMFGCPHKSPAAMGFLKLKQ